jgi:hypothetical protein
MARESARTGVDLEARIGSVTKDVTRSGVGLVLPVVVFIVLTGVWACLWVPPLRGS